MCAFTAASFGSIELDKENKMMNSAFSFNERAAIVTSPLWILCFFYFVHFRPIKSAVILSRVVFYFYLFMGKRHLFCFFIVFNQVL